MYGEIQSAVNNTCKDKTIIKQSTRYCQNAFQRYWGFVLFVNWGYSKEFAQDFHYSLPSLSTPIFVPFVIFHVLKEYHFIYCRAEVHHNKHNGVLPIFANYHFQIRAAIMSFQSSLVVFIANLNGSFQGE